MLRPSDLVRQKPPLASIWGRESPRCEYDHVSQVRQWSQSEQMRQVIMSTGSPTSSAQFDGESDE